MRSVGMQTVSLGFRLMMAVAVVAAALIAPMAALADTTGVADCAPVAPLEKSVFSELVFVGRVTEVANGGRSATVEVSEVWRGDIPPSVTVDGGFNPADVAEDDRIFDVGATYLFIPSVIDTRIVDGVCSPTVQWTDDLGRFRPADAHGPSLARSVNGSNPLAFLGDLAGPIATTALVGGAALLLAFVVAGRHEA